MRLAVQKEHKQEQEFQSTHPLRGATVSAGNVVILNYISIHAPLAGCDLLSRARNVSRKLFQSTHPLRGATLSFCDIYFFERFQSTHPLRGATYAGRCCCANPRYFNPRTPCGVRLLKGWCFPMADKFQSTHPLRGATPVRQITVSYTHLTLPTSNHV